MHLENTFQTKYFGELKIFKDLFLVKLGQGDDSELLF